MDLENLKDRREFVNVRDIFPNFDPDVLTRRFPITLDTKLNPHQRLLDIIMTVDDGGYDFILDNFGFHDPKFAKFLGHCHQMTPALAVVLEVLGYGEVAYLEGYRIDPETREMIPPEMEQSAMKEEFCSIGRIPYCCLQVKLDGGELLYLSPKHIRRGNNGSPKALLTPICYREMIGVLAHPDDPQKSGVYLDVVQKDPVIWRKQTYKDPVPEEFRTFAFMSVGL